MQSTNICINLKTFRRSLICVISSSTSNFEGHAMATLGTAMDQRSVADCPGPQSGGVLRPTPTLPTLPVAAHMTSQTSAFQQPARTAAMIAEAEASLPPAPHPRDGGSAAGAGLRAELFQTTSEDELAATTVGLLSSRAGPSQLNRQRSHDSNDGHDELFRPSAPAVHASQQAILQQQVRINLRSHET